MSSPQFTKIKHDPKRGRTTLEYLVGNGTDEPDEYRVSTTNPPHPDFTAALARLAPHVLSLCELQGAVNEDQLEVRGASFSYNGEVMGATITALRKLTRSSAPLVLNTPFKFAEPIGEDTPEEQLLGNDTVVSLELLAEEALAFLDGGKRGEREEDPQSEMFDEEPPAGGQVLSLTARRKAAR